jgi:transcriptional regulator with XRE-family HTH domain
MFPIVPVQCWLAREALGWSASHLARVAQMSRKTVVRFERGEPLKACTVEVIQRTLEKAGVIFIDADDGGPGARLMGSGEVASKVPPPNEYHVVVTQRGLSWEWEICRDGIPLPVPLRDGLYTSKSAALGQSPKQVNRSACDWNHAIRQSSSQIEAVNLAGVLSGWKDCDS